MVESQPLTTDHRYSARLNHPALEHEAQASADAIQQQALNNPAFRDVQLTLLTDDLLLQRFPLATSDDVSKLRSSQTHTA